MHLWKVSIYIVNARDAEKKFVNPKNNLAAVKVPVN